MEEGMYETKDMIDQVYQMISQGQQQQNQGQMRFNQGQGQNQNRFNQGQNRFNNRGRGHSQNFGQRRNGQQFGQNRNGGNNKEVYCTFCKRYRHQVGNCIALKAELRKRGYKIAGGTTGGFNGTNGHRNGQAQGRGGFNNRGGRNGFQNKNGGRQNFDRFNSMNEEECDENYDEMDDEDSFLCCLSEFQENTGLEVVTYEESN